jgi:hypothetical protein
MRSTWRGSNGYKETGERRAIRSHNQTKKNKKQNSTAQWEQTCLNHTKNQQQTEKRQQLNNKTKQQLQHAKQTTRQQHPNATND